MSNIVPTDFWGGTDLSDFTPPQVVIAQPTSKKGKAGKFVFNNGREEDAIPGARLLRVLKSRVLFGKKFSDPSLCGSDDFYMPSPRYKKPIWPSCLSCPLQKWGDDIPEKNQLVKELWGKSWDRKPVCAEIYWMLMTESNNLPFFIQFKKTQIKVVQDKLLSRLRFGFPQVPPWTVAFDMKVQDQGQSYVPAFDNYRVIPQEEVPLANQVYEGYAPNAHGILFGQLAQLDADKDVSDVPF